MLSPRFMKLAMYGMYFFALLSMVLGFYLKGYIIDNQDAWRGRSDLIKVVVFLGGDPAPRMVAYMYYASCVSFLAFVTLLSFLKKK